MQILIFTLLTKMRRNDFSQNKKNSSSTIEPELSQTLSHASFFLLCCSTTEKQINNIHSQVENLPEPYGRI
jgi:hypothetical protein